MRRLLTFLLLALLASSCGPAARTTDSSLKAGKKGEDGGKEEDTKHDRNEKKDGKKDKAKDDPKEPVLLKMPKELPDGE
jgi:hypothetical protein